MDMYESSASDATVSDVHNRNTQDAPSSQSVFPFLKLPRELRDQIYNHAFSIPDDRSERSIRIERRNLKYFQPSAAAILLVLHHEYFLLNRQVAGEALEVLFKKHTIFLSCGPFVLKSLLEKIEQQNGPGRQWLKWIQKIELDWVTFPNLRIYPPERGEDGKDEWYWEQDEEEVDVDYVRGAQYNGHYDEYDHEGGDYEDNFYEPDNTSLYPSFHQNTATTQMTTSANDPFGFANHYPFTDPSQDPAQDEAAAATDDTTKLDLLVVMEVAPLFAYLASPTFNLSSITLPLYFISKQSHHHRSVTRPGYALPLKIRYWVQICVYALIMLRSSSSTLQQVRIKYMPWDIWASMEPADDLHRMLDKGIWFDGPEDGEGGERESEGEAFRAIWAGMKTKMADEKRKRMGLDANVTFVPWDGNVDGWRVGDELDVVLARAQGD